MRVLFFGTYDKERHPRIRVLQEGFAELGHEVLELCYPLGFTTDERVKILQAPRLLPKFGFRMLSRWRELWRASRSIGDLDAVVVGYMGHFDVHLARRLWPGGTVVLDHLISAASTSWDRGERSSKLLRMMEWLDRRATEAADIVCVDTEENVVVSGHARARCMVVPVGATTDWFRQPTARTRSPIRVVFFGLYTPLHGAPVIGRAIGDLRDNGSLSFTMIGRGQDLEETRRYCRASDRVSWIPWVVPTHLPETVAHHDICLGVFGANPKSFQVVPSKVYQGAAAGCAVITSDTAPQRRALGESAVFVQPGDHSSLARSLADLAADPIKREDLRQAAFVRAMTDFRPEVVVRPLVAAIEKRVSKNASSRASSRLRPPAEANPPGWSSVTP